MVSSVQFKMVSTRTGKPIRVPNRPSEFFPKSPLLDSQALAAFFHASLLQAIESAVDLMAAKVSEILTMSALSANFESRSKKQQPQNKQTQNKRKKRKKERNNNKKQQPNNNNSKKSSASEWKPVDINCIFLVSSLLKKKEYTV